MIDHPVHKNSLQTSESMQIKSLDARLNSGNKKNLIIVEVSLRKNHIFYEEKRNLDVYFVAITHNLLSVIASGQ